MPIRGVGNSAITEPSRVWGIWKAINGFSARVTVFLSLMWFWLRDLPRKFKDLHIVAQLHPCSRPSLCLVLCIFFSLYLLYIGRSFVFFFFLWLYLWHEEVPGPGVKLVPQQRPKIPQWQYQILNPLGHMGTLRDPFLSFKIDDAGMETHLPLF